MRNFFLILFLSSVFASDYLVLKTYSNTLGSELTESDLTSIDMLFSEDLSQYGEVENSSASCTDNDCALSELSKTDNDYVIYTKIMKLGSKIIYTGYVLNDESTFTSKVTALSVEDMENAVMRLAKSLALQESTGDVVDVDNIVESEEQESARRQSLGRVGFSIGYMYPTFDSYAIRSGGDATGNEATWEHEYGPSSTRYDSQKIKFSTNYFYEFKENTALLSEISWYTGLPFSWGADISMIKYLDKSDTSPFIGAGVGLNWVSYCSESCYNMDKPDAHKRSGPTLNIQGGYILFRTYNVNVMARARYHLILNTDLDQGFTVDIGVERKRPAREAVGRNPIKQVAMGIGYFYLAMVFIAVIASN